MCQKQLRSVYRLHNSNANYINSEEKHSQLIVCRQIRFDALNYINTNSISHKNVAPKNPRQPKKTAALFVSHFLPLPLRSHYIAAHIPLPHVPHDPAAPAGRAYSKQAPTESAMCHRPRVTVMHLSFSSPSGGGITGVQDVRQGRYLWSLSTPRTNERSLANKNKQTIRSFLSRGSRAGVSKKVTVHERVRVRGDGGVT